MGIQKRHEIWCDNHDSDCGQWEYLSATKASTAAKEAAKKGWVRRHRGYHGSPAYLWICPKCIEEEARVEKTRQERLDKGCCPTHGIGLAQVGVATRRNGVPYADIAGCPRKDCDFEVEVRPGTALDRAVRGL